MLLDERSSGIGLGHWVLLLGENDENYLVFDSNLGVPAFIFDVTVFSCFWAIFSIASIPSHPIRNYRILPTEGAVLVATVLPLAQLLLGVLVLFGIQKRRALFSISFFFADLCGSRGLCGCWWTGYFM